MGVIKTLYHRAKKICLPELFSKETKDQTNTVKEWFYGYVNWKGF